MKYRDYKINAKKHLDACISILNTYSDKVVPESVLRELHYLSGYIIEGICVYAIYKHYEWEEDRDIKKYDEDFTRKTGLDYYKNGNSKVRYKYNGTNSAVYWWNRSPYSDNSNNFCSVGTVGSAASHASRYCRAVAPCFYV